LATFKPPTLRKTFRLCAPWSLRRCCLYFSEDLAANAGLAGTLSTPLVIQCDCGDQRSGYLCLDEKQKVQLSTNGLPKAP
jgi:hypothetical protein